MVFPKERAVECQLWRCRKLTTPASRSSGWFRCFSPPASIRRVCSRQNGAYRYLGDRRDATVRDARDLLLDPQTRAAVFEVSSEMILRQGLPFDRCDVGIVLAIDYPGSTISERTAPLERLLLRQRDAVHAVAASGRGGALGRRALAPELATVCRGEVIYL